MLSQFWNNISEASADLILFGSRIETGTVILPSPESLKRANWNAAQVPETEGDEETASPNKDEEEEVFSTLPWWNAFTGTYQ